MEGKVIEYNNSGVKQFVSGKFLEAEELYQKALELNPDFKEASDNKTNALQLLESKH